MPGPYPWPGISSLSFDLSRGWKRYLEISSGGACVDRQRVYVPAHQFGGGSIDHPMSFDRRHAGEGRGRNDHVEMAALARSCVSGVFGAVVANLEQRGMEFALQCLAQFFHAGHVDSCDW